MISYYKTHSSVSNLEFATVGSACFDMRAFFLADDELSGYDQYNTPIRRKADIEDEMGDVLFSIVNISRKLKVNPEEALQKINAQIN